MIKSNRVTAAVLAGLAGGLADILVAFVIYRPATPPQIFQAVGSGLVGPSIFQMGTTGVVIGALAHFGVSIVLGALYLVAAVFAPVLLTRPLLGGVAYGTFVFGIMNAIVVPLSLAAPRPAPPDHLTWLGWLANIVFGVVLALVAARLLSRKVP